MPAELPPELWLHNIRLALPYGKLSKVSPPDGSWTPHSSNLRSFSLVCAQWRALAQPLLFEQCFVKGSALGGLADALEKREELRKAVRVVKLFHPQGRVEDLERVLRNAPKLEQLSLSQAGEFDMALLRFTPHLRTFSAWGCTLSLSSPPSPFTLPSLSTLSICGCSLSPSLSTLSICGCSLSPSLPSSFFLPSLLPSLSSAAVCYARPTPGDDTSPERHLLDSFHPSLHVLTTFNPRIALLPSQTRGATVYTCREEALDWMSDQDQNISEGFSAGSSEGDGIEHLQLTDLYIDSLVLLLGQIREDPTCRGLKSLVLAAEKGRDTSGFKREAEDWAKKLKERDGRNVRVEVVEDELEFMEESLVDEGLWERHEMAQGEREE
ncbi:hypothetical protein JCM8547_007656 [Rhodosporidiobolus lusitaniae]